MKTTGFNNLKELILHFSDEKVCREHLEKRRWNGKPVCPHCHCDKIYKLKDEKTYKCAGKDCKKKFTVTVGTIFENTNIPLSTWFAAIYLATAHKKGISSVQLAKDLGITQKSAWFVLHRIREMLREKKSPMLGNNDIVEIDETYVKNGGDRVKKEVHPNEPKRGKQGRSLKDKTPVFGMVERNGKVVAKPVKNTKLKTLKPFIENMIMKGAIIVTDEFSVYNKLDNNYRHFVVNHSRKEYARGKYHTNTIEGFFGLLKRSLIGIYHYMSTKHLERYCDEIAYRYNTRNERDSERFDVTLQLLEGRLTYKNLISNVRGYA